MKVTARHDPRVSANTSGYRSPRLPLCRRRRDEAERSRAAPCHLGRAAHRVGILHAAAVGMRRVDRGCRSEGGKIGRRDRLAPEAAAASNAPDRTAASTLAVHRCSAPPRCRRRARAARPASRANTRPTPWSIDFSARPSFGAKPRGLESGAGERRRAGSREPSCHASPSR